MDYKRIDKELIKINHELTARGSKIKLERLRDSLWARGTFPPKPGETKSKQRKVSLSISARLHNLVDAKQLALKLSNDLEFGKFVWPESPVSDFEPTVPVLTKDWIEKLRLRYFETRIDNEDNRLNWLKDYGYILTELPADKPLTLEICERTILNNHPVIEGSSPKQRNRMVMACGRLLNLAQIDAKDLKRLRVDERDAPIKLSEIPDLTQIIECKDRIPVRWKFTYSLCAAYGLRPHEVWLCDFSELSVDRALIVNPTKTNRTRFVYPYPPELFDLFDLGATPAIPESNSKSRKGRAALISQVLRRAKCNFTPYDLRHQYVYQMCKANVPVAYQCDMLGHSPAVHHKHYRLFTRSLDRVREIRAAILESNQSVPIQSS